MGLIKVYGKDAAGIQAKVKDRLDQRVNGLFNYLEQEFNNLMQEFWENSAGLTPQQVFDAYGTDAAQWFALANDLANMMNAIVPNTVDPTPPLPYTINPDGTVKVG
jgi:hypothetical protein